MSAPVKPSPRPRHGRRARPPGLLGFFPPQLPSPAPWHHSRTQRHVSPACDPTQTTKDSPLRLMSSPRVTVSVPPHSQHVPLSGVPLHRHAPSLSSPMTITAKAAAHVSERVLGTRVISREHTTQAGAPYRWILLRNDLFSKVTAVLTGTIRVLMAPRPHRCSLHGPSF